MSDAVFKQGNPLMVDHTPGSAVTAGQVIVAGDFPVVAHVDQAAGKMMGVASFGGVYEVTADAALTGGAKVAWDATAKKVTLTTSGSKNFGRTTPDSTAAADGDKVLVVHDPDGTAIT